MNVESVSGPRSKTAPPLGPWGRRILWVIVAPFIPLALLLLLLVVAVTLQVGRVYTVPTSAMSPTIIKGDQIFSSQVNYRFQHPKRGDVVCFRSDGILELENETSKVDTTYVKRVAGLPGETISLHGGQLWVNGSPAPELASRHYEPAPEGIDLTFDGDSFTVPAESYFVLGDNSANSLDSRYWGCVPAANLRGRALFRFWPPSRMGLIN